MKQRRIGFVLLGALAVAAALPRAQETPEYGPAKGTLVIVGGGNLNGSGINEKFIELAGGPEKNFVIVPTAGGNRNAKGELITYDEARIVAPWVKLGIKHVRMLHTHDPKVADTEAFAKVLRTADAVWFNGGRQWNIVDSYAGTLTYREFHKVLERGGVIGGSSAGATIQGQYLVRGDTSGPNVMMTAEPAHQDAFKFLRKVAIDQHINTRNRWDDLTPVIKKYPDLLGIGLSEATAIVVRGDRFEVIGAAKVAIHDDTRTYAPGEKPYILLSAGDAYNMKTRKVEKAAPSPRIVAGGLQAPSSNLQPPFDILILNGHVVDGTGSPWYAADVGIRDGRIAAIGRLAGSPAKQTIDAGGKVVAPGFIDMLGQSELTVLVEPTLPSKIFQGITTEITGEGGSAAPLNDAILKADAVGYNHLKLVPDWRTFGQYFARLEKQGMGINLASYVGATQVRRMVLGDEDKQPGSVELDRMKALVREAMEQGAVGVSTSLQYAPAPYAKTEELVALAAEAAKYGGIYATHMRSEAGGVLEALDEAIRIGREAHIPVEIWHIKAAGKANWGRMKEIVAKVEQARREGIDITADTYAYPAWFNSFSAFVPPWAHDGGDDKLLARLKDPTTRARIKKDILSSDGQGWDNEWQEIPGPEAVLIGAVQNPELESIQGKTLADVAALWKMDPVDTLLEILSRDHAFTYVAVFGMSEPDVALAVSQPWVAFDNDSQGTAPTGLLGREHPHPRAYGTFPRVLRKFVREDKLLSLEESIRKMTALPAQKMRLADRGVLKSGMWADVVVFDAATITDKATFAEPNQLSAGMEYVLVNGVPVISAGKATGALPGRVLRGPGAR